MREFSIEITSVPDRDKLVAEIWLDDILVAEINQENQDPELEIYISEEKINLPLNNFLKALKEARDKLLLQEK